MTTKTINLYTFDELSDKAKERAREWWRECEAETFGAHGELWEPIETAAGLLGIDLRRQDVPLMSGKKRSEPCIYWTLHVQGAGTSFDATYSYRKGSVKAIKAEFGTDEKLHSIAETLAELQAKYRYQVTASIKSDTRGHFLEVETDTAADVDVDAFRDAFNDFAHWIYRYIADEYDYRMTDENVDDAIHANEYTFLENGKRED